jgi:hypothetical protein
LHQCILGKAKKIMPNFAQGSKLLVVIHFI